MTSFEIVNNRLYALQHKDFGNLGVIEISKKELNQIKQELEILYIIKKNFCYVEEFLSETPYLEGHCEISQKDREKIKKLWGVKNNGI